jgi:ribonuclease P protein component
VAFVQVTAPNGPLVGYAVGRRVATAVVRNRLRRRIRVVMRDMAAGLGEGAYLISAGSGATALSPDELRDSVAQAVRRAVARAPREGG